MKIGIVGLPNVGKSTLFNALTKNYSAQAENFPFCTIEPNIGIVNVNDKRLEEIGKAVGTEKIIPATAEFIDIAGIVKGASKGEGLGNKFLAHIRECDAILQVVRLFKDDKIIHIHSEINPRSDIEIVNSELILADIESIEKRIIKDSKKAKSDKEIMKALIVWEKVLKELSNGILVSNLNLDEEEKSYIYDLHLLTNKKFVYACNLSEDMMNINKEKLKKILDLGIGDFEIVPVCAKLESDMIELSSEDRKDFLEDLGLITTGLDDLIKTSYDALGLHYYFTAGEKEVKAWTIKKGAIAPEAAGIIHSDFQKGFIKADVVNWKDIVEYSGWTKARENGRVSLEGKEYVVKDGDIILFKFN